MELNEFIKTYIPDSDKNFAKNKNGYLDFVEKYFPEAIQKFADRICEKQRFNCGRIALNRLTNKQSAEVSNAEQPKIDEI